MTTTATKLTFHRNAYTVSPRGTKVYFALTYGQIEGMPDYAPSGSYQIEKLSATMWVVITQVGTTAEARRESTRRIGIFKTLSQAQTAAQNDNAR